MCRTLFGEYYGEMGAMAHMFFPIRQLISSITRDQVTDELRSQLLKFHLRLAPSPSGKIEPRDLEFRT